MERAIIVIITVAAIQAVICLWQILTGDECPPVRTGSKETTLPLPGRARWKPRPSGLR